MIGRCARFILVNSAIAANCTLYLSLAGNCGASVAAVISISTSQISEGSCKYTGFFSIQAREITRGISCAAFSGVIKA